MQSCCTSNVMMVVVGMHLCCVITDRLFKAISPEDNMRSPFLYLYVAWTICSHSLLSLLCICAAQKETPPIYMKPRENIANREITEGKLGVLRCQVMFQFG